MRNMSIVVLLAMVSLIARAEDVGQVSFANSGAAEAQEPFHRGLALLHNFEYVTAAEAFREAQQKDPSFAMAYWGEAMTHTHPIWFQQDLDAARAILQRLGATAGERLAKAKTERERDYLRTLDVLYGAGSKEERDFLYADAMAALHARYPDDVDATAFHALALLGTAHAGRDFTTYMRAAALLEEVFPSNQRHPGVLHYLIHSYDDPVHAPLGMRAARLYGAVAPNAPHALHMTSHIFIAMAMWDEVVDANRRAIDVTNRQRAARGRPAADCGHYPSWLHYAYLQQKRGDEARKALDACRASAFTEPFRPGGFMDSRRARMEAYASMRAYHVASGFPLTADDRVTIPDEYVDARFTIAYGDVLAAFARGEASALANAVAQMRALQKEVLAGIAKEATAANPTQRITAEVMMQEAEALQLLAAKRGEEALPILEAAAKAERSMPLEFGPPVIPKPAAELLAEQLAAAGRAAEAAAAYRMVFERTPGRTVSVEGLRHVQAPAVKREEKPASAHVH
jgi:hypothetical protein